MTPNMTFALTLPARIRVGRGASLDAVPEIAALGRRLVLVHGRSAERAEPLRAALVAAGCEITAMSCAREPTLPMLLDALSDARESAPDAVVAVGGGAVLDMGKALAALLPSTAGSPLDHLEVVGAGLPLTVPPLTCAAVPTTAGTGSEATRNAVIGVPDHARKVSLRDDRMVPDIAIVDPALMDGTPAPQTLASGFDAVTQVIEPYLSCRANPFTDALARPAIGMGLRALVKLMEGGEQKAARDDLAWVAHVSGIALANAGLGAVHGLAGVLGGETGAPHGVICARLLPHVLSALDRSADTESTRLRLSEVCGEIDAIVPGGLDGLTEWMSRHGLGELPVLDKATRDRIAGAAQDASSMKASPVLFEARELAAILSAAESSGNGTG
ncbi:iron-containing alcohol dehydrogenase [Roseivivax marinus]|uniref:iron-containing alcohol dehydrogenase n=1 Tax=Roseivivax marinus TaxID=1379903 RepID=UPI003B97BA25